MHYAPPDPTLDQKTPRTPLILIHLYVKPQIMHIFFYETTKILSKRLLLLLVSGDFIALSNYKLARSKAK